MKYLFQLGHIVSDETKEKIRQSKLGIKNPNYGKKTSDEIKQKLSLALMGNKNSVGKVSPMKGKTASLETREKQRQAKLKNPTRYWLGKRAPTWKGGTSFRRQSLGNKLYVEWRTAVFKRDNYTCQWCGARCSKGNTVILNADHIKPWSKYPDLRFELTNGRTLCLPCHKTTDTYGSKCNNIN